MKTLKKAILLISALALVAFAQVSELSEKPSAPALAETATANEVVAPADIAKPDSTADTLSPRERPEEPMDTPELTIGNAGEDLRINSDVGLGIDDPLAKFHISAGDASYALFGPNASWAGKLYVGATPNIGTALTAQVIATDGNLHLDPAPSKNMYLGYYQPRDIYIAPTGGNVGIGTSNPSFKTTVSQDMTMSGDINPGSAQLSVEGASVPGKRMILGYDTNSNGFGYIKAGNYGVTWTNLALQPSGGNVGIGRTDPQQKLEVLGTARITSTSYPGPSGDYRYIDIYSVLANYIDASNDLYIRPKGGLILQPGYPTSGTGNIQVKDGGAYVYGTFYGGSRVLDMTGNAGGLRLGANNWSDGGTSYGHIVSDNGSYKALMIVGNNISGNSGRGREVKVWDYLNVQGALNVTGQFVSVGNTSVVTNLNADMLDGLHSSSFDQSNSNEIQNLSSVLSTGNSAGGQNILAVGDIQCTQNYGLGLVGVYSDTRYQNVFAMGTSWRLSADGTSPGNLYGIAWTHSNIGGQSISGLGHQMLIMSNGNTRSAIGDGIWTNYSVQANANVTAGAEIYVGNWVRHSDNDGTYWSNTGWHVYPKDASDMYFRTGSGNGGICGTVADATPRGYIHWTTSNEIGFLNSSRNWSFRVDNSGNTFATASSRAPIFYDSDNTAYYVDPASTSNLNAVYTYSYQGNGNVGGTGNASWHPSGIYSAGTNWFYGTTYAFNGIWYDANNSAYYLDPDGYSNLNDIGWGNSGTRTQTRDNAGLRGDAGARSGFFETSSPTNYYSGASSWQHLLDVRHSNNGNNYAMQFSGSFFDQRLFFRKTNDNAAQAWSQIPVSSTGSIYAYTTTTIYSDANVDIQWNGSYYQPQFLHKTSAYWWDVTWNMQNGSGTQYRDGDDIATSSYTWYYFSGDGSLNTSLNLGSGSSYGSEGTYWLGYESNYGTSAYSSYKIELFRRGIAVTYVVTRYH